MPRRAHREDRGWSGGREREGNLWTAAVIVACVGRHGHDRVDRLGLSAASRPGAQGLSLAVRRLAWAE